MFGNMVQQVVLVGALLLPLLLAGHLLAVVVVVVFDGHVLEVGQVLDRFGEGHLLMIHEKLYDVARLAAAKALVYALAGADAKAGRFLVMKWAAGLVVSALLLQVDEGF